VLKEAELERYGRQINIFGEEGQKKLKRASVFIAGVGALGSSVSVYLAAAGVGKIRIVDNDMVELSNLNRQILHRNKDLGDQKATSAARTLEELNPEIEVEPIAERLTEDNIWVLVDGCELIVDATDNFPTRFLLNEVSLKDGMPLFHGAVEGFEGRAMTIIPQKTACLRCVYLREPPPKAFPILGATAGVIGCIQATEVIKYLTGIGQLLADRLLIYDGQTMTFDAIKLKRNPDCPSCGFGSK